MTDILTLKQRSVMMARIRSTGNASTELRLVALLRAGGVTGWRRGCRLRLRGQTTDDGRQRTEVTGDKVQGAEGGGGKDSPRSAQRARREKRRAKGGSVSAASAVRSRRPVTVKPDFVFRKERLVVFVDGCFWHGCPRHYTRPKSRRAFWDAKIAANKARDRRVDRALRADGWRVLHVWEHALNARELGRTLARVRRVVTSGR